MGLREFTSVPADPREWGRWMRAQFITADSVAPNTITTGMIIDDQVTFAKFQNLNALSVFGRSVNSAGDGANISAASDGDILRRAGLTIGFGSILSTSISDFTEAVQDVAGASLTDTTSIDFTYTDATGLITAAVLPGGVNHNALLNYVADQHVAHTVVSLTAGSGLTGGGDISASRTFDVGAGTGITVNANDVAVTLSAAFAWTGDHTFTNASGVHLVQPTAASGADLFLDGRSGGINRVRFTTDGGATTSELRFRDNTAGSDRLNLASTLATFTTPLSVTGNLTLSTAGNKLLVKEGSNAAMGNSTLVAGTVTVSNTLVTASSRIFLSRATTGGTVGHLSYTRVASTSFTINSSSATDTSTIDWLIVEPSP